MLIRIYDKRFVIGIYHKVDDFNFDVINFPFPDSNIHSETGYNTFYSQLVRFFRLCNNVTDFSVRVCMVRSKLCSRGYKEKLMHKYFLKFCKNYPVLLKYSVPDNESLWLSTYHSEVSSCCITDQKAVRKLIKPSKILLQNLHYNSKSPSSHSTVNNSSVFNTKDSKPYTPISLEPLTPCGLSNPHNHCYLNSVLQIFIRILPSIKNNIQFNGTDESDLTKYFLNVFQIIVVNIYDVLKRYCQAMTSFLME